MITKEQFLDKVKSISFNEDITPDKPISLKKVLGYSNEISWRVTQFPTKENLKVMSKIYGMSSAANCYLINEICKSLDEKETYLNVGTWRGMTFVAGMIDTQCQVIGVDNFSQFQGPKDELLEAFNKFKNDNSKFFDMDYIDYFKTNKNELSFYFYDGEHSYENQYKGVELALPFMKKGGLIMVDDTNGDAPRKGTLNALKDFNVEYDIWLDQKTNHNSHPTFHNGIMIVQVNEF